MPKQVRHLWPLLVLAAFAAQSIQAVERLDSEANRDQKAVVAKPRYSEGQHYRKLKMPAQTEVSPGQIEVVEVFWYGCPHCYSLETLIDKWKPSLPEDVTFIRVPAVYNSPDVYTSNIWKSHAQLYYTVKALDLDLNITEKAHDAIFNEIQTNRNTLEKQRAMAEFLSKKFGVKKDNFNRNFKSIGITHQLAKAYSLMRSYALAGVPAIVVDGRYVVDPKLAGSLANMTDISDYLINKVKAERAQAQKKPSPAA